MGTHTKGIEEWAGRAARCKTFSPFLKDIANGARENRVWPSHNTGPRHSGPSHNIHNAMSDAQRASILRTLQASDIWMALRLPANAAADVVRQAFRKESRLLHPDKNPMPEAEAQASHSAPTACTAGPARTRLAYI